VIATSAQALWFLTRGSGVITLVLLTAVVALGIAGRVCWSSERWPRFITQGLHRNLSLLVVAFVGIHVATAVIDGYAPIRWIDALVPFVSAYRPLWLGLGAVAFDLLLALVITSLLRARLGFGAWRAVHWFAYACWPIALLHGVGTGSDTQTVWMLGLDALSVAVVLAALRWRLAKTQPSAFARAVTVSAGVVGTIGLAAFLVAGPLQAGWARTAGTPSAPSGGTAASGPSPGADAPAETALPAEAPFTGSARQRVGADGTVLLDLSGTVEGTVPLVLDIKLQGQAAGDGGLSVQGGQVRLGPEDDPSRYQGSIAGIDDGRIQAQLRDPGGASVTLVAALQIAGSSGDVRGTIAFSGTA
jgi:Ferric reductase like transmembrane component